jgi:hypothetical protein
MIMANRVETVGNEVTEVGDDKGRGLTKREFLKASGAALLVAAASQIPGSEGRKGRVDPEVARDRGIYTRDERYGVGEVAG